ncbi:putative uncharacterized protein [Parachlamydia acanthamoebae UV-7]|jgi:hypothetical protein|uniref:Uncharacterized protein n=2 Tax=Parachlamydia acanthamoebae TaxID=83552 RepID=F8L0F1_PARAV|nr:hypothetical protein [Parachlamydia acanthamoebae]EFB41655.1 hypothetical protein pah_c026o095 [Parachlamydia acanthamoebae str. Hall's coccus]CCB86685.1 putative uncharacterized protein [Parachlamydia acanthamoebae UV-7]
MSIGTTIHYRGYLKDHASIDACIEAIRNFASKKGWEFEEFEEKDITIDRMYEDDQEKVHEWEYHGPIKGITVNTHETCEDLCFAFDNDLFFQEYVKTQYAPSDVHVEIINLLRSLQEHTKELVVDDEGQYWDTQDLETLNANLQETQELLEEILNDNPSCEGPVWLPDGRIADFVEKDALEEPAEKSEE